MNQFDKGIEKRCGLDVVGDKVQTADSIVMDQLE